MINIDIADIVVEPDRMRRLRPEKVDELVGSIKRHKGLLQPIIVRLRESDGARVLVAGLHRLEAARKLGHTSIRADLLGYLDADQAKLIEIDENLIRADLSAAERKLHIAERKKLYRSSTRRPSTARSDVAERVRKNGDTSNGSPRPPRSRPVTPSAACSATSLTPRKSACCPTSPGPASTKRARSTRWPRLSESEQHKLAERAKSGEQVSAKPISTDTKGRKQPAKKKRRTEDDFRRDVRAKKAAAIATAVPGEIGPMLPAEPPADPADAVAANPITAAWDNAGEKQQKEFVKQRRVEIARVDSDFLRWATPEIAS